VFYLQWAHSTGETT